MDNGDARTGRAEGSDEFIDGAPCGLLTLATDGRIAAVNDVFLAWTGFERDELIRKRRFDELLTVPCRIYYETHCAPLLRLQGFMHEIALDIMRRDERVLPTFVNAVEKPGANGSVELVRFAVFAAVERREYERELLLARRNSEQAAKAKADFLAMFAHELRNPLSAVRMEIELLLRHHNAASADDHIPGRRAELAAEAIGRIRTSVDRVLGLLNDMLDIGKLEAGRLGLQETEFELTNVVQAVVHTLRPLAQYKQLPLQVGVDPTLPKRLFGDPMKLGQALTNLVGNAIKFTESGMISIGAESVSQSSDLVNVRFWVKDTGIGIAPDRQALIFEEYTQADPSIAHRYGGTGLGLAIATKLVELQHGHLCVSSEPGRGSVFSFEIPLKKAC